MIKNIKTIVLNQKGMSLIQVMVTVALSVLLVSLFTSMFLNISKTEKEFQAQALTNADTRLAESFIFKAFRDGGVSFNVLKLPDKDKKSFFDYDSSLTCGLKTENYRTIILTPGSPSFELLVEKKKKNDNNEELSPLLIVTPVRFYTQSEDDELSFVSINKNDYLKNGPNPFFWQPGQLILFDMTARLTPPEGGPARSPIFLGAVGPTAPASDAQFAVFSDDPEHLKKFFLEDPRTGSSYTNVDSFLRMAPVVGGGQPIIRAIMVELQRYRVTEDAKLVREIFIDKKWQNTFVFADQIKQVQIMRPSGCQRTMEVKIIKKEN